MFFLATLLEVVNYIFPPLVGVRLGRKCFPPHLHPLPVGRGDFLFPYLLKILTERRIKIMNLLLHFFSPNIDCPGTPILLFRIHAQDLHFPEGMDGIVYWILKALPDIADTAHPGALVPAKRFLIKFLRRNGARADHGEVSEWKSWKVSDLRNLKDALKEDGYQFHLPLQAFLVNSLDTL